MSDLSFLVKDLESRTDLSIRILSVVLKNMIYIYVGMWSGSNKHFSVHEISFEKS